MSDDDKSRDAIDHKSDQQHNRRKSDRVDEDKGPEALHRRAGDTTAEPDTEGGDEGDTEEVTFEDGVDDHTGLRATAIYHRAVSDYDPEETEIQISEHWGFNDRELVEHGSF